VQEELEHFEEAQQLHAEGQWGLAALHYQMALELAPDFSEARYQLGLLHKAQHEPEQAILCFKEVLDHNPLFAAAYFQLGQIYQSYYGAFEEALHYYRKTQQLDMQYAEAYYCAGMLQKELGQFAQASQSFLKFVQFQPDRADVYTQLGELMTYLQQPLKASQYYSKALEIDPENTQALMPWLHLKIGQDPHKMMAFLIEIATSYPHLRSQIACQVGRLMEGIDDTDEAQKCYQMALEDPELPDREAWQLKEALLLSLFPKDKASQEAQIEKLKHSLQTFEADPHFLAENKIHEDFSNAESYFLSWHALLQLAYTAHDPRVPREQLARLLQKCLPPLPGQPRQSLRPDKRRVGFVLYESGAVHKFLIGILQRLSDPELEIFIFMSEYGSAYFSPMLQTRDFEQILLSNQVPEALQQILEADLDILFFSEPNTTHMNQTLLAAYRLAPIQVTSWLSSGTTGQPHMDYFLSSHLLERAENPQDLYSEQLVLNQTIPTFFARPEKPTPWPRSDYGLPAEGRLYLCPHVMSKLQPDFDAILAGILKQDPEGQLVLVTNPDLPANRDALLLRFEAEMPEQLPRIWFLPKLNPADFLSLLLLGEVMLDPLYFGGGTTSYEALALGLPVVTLPGERLHGRITQACYLKMGITECIVSSPEAYIATAVKIATDAEYNQALREKILQKSGLIFEEALAVREMENFLRTVQIR